MNKQMHTLPMLEVTESASGKPLIVATDSGKDVAKLLGDTPRDWGWAALFAAAPELLAALEQIIPQLPEVWSMPGAGMYETLVAARAAVSKARVNRSLDVSR